MMAQASRRHLAKFWTETTGYGGDDLQLRRSPPGRVPYSPYCGEQVFCEGELPLYGVLGSTFAHSCICAWKGNSPKLLALAHPPGLLRCRRFSTHPECLNHRSHTPDEHEDRQDKR